MSAITTFASILIGGRIRLEQRNTIKRGLEAKLAELGGVGTAYSAHARRIFSAVNCDSVIYGLAVQMAPPASRNEPSD